MCRFYFVKCEKNIALHFIFVVVVLSKSLLYVTFRHKRSIPSKHETLSLCCANVYSQQTRDVVPMLWRSVGTTAGQRLVFAGLSDIVI